MFPINIMLRILGQSEHTLIATMDNSKQVQAFCEV